MTTGNLAMIVGVWRDGALPVSLTTSGWTEVVLVNNDSNNTTSARFWYREVDGTEGSTVSFTFDSAREATFNAFEVSGWDDATAPTGAGFDYNTTKTASPNPPSHSWAWSTDTLVIAGFAFRSTDTVTANPTGYTLFADTDNGGSAQNRLDTKDVSSSPEDPAAYTTDSDDQCVAFTIAIPSAAAGGTDVLLANDVESASEVTTPSIGQEHSLAANDVSATSEVSTPAVGQEHALAADDVESASEVSAPALGQEHALAANDVESASEVTAPALGQEHTLTADDVESASEVTAPAIGQVHALTAVNVEAASEVSAPAIGQEHNLAADDVESASQVTAPALGTDGTDALTADDVEAASEVTAPALGQVHVLFADDIEAASEVTAPALGTDGVVEPPVGRGDDAPGMRYGNEREGFWRKKADDWLEEYLDRIPEVAKQPKRKKRKLAAEFEAEFAKISQEFMANSEEIPARVDAVAGLIEQLKQPSPDYSALAAMVADIQAQIQADRTRRRRKRDIEAVLILAA